MPETAYEISVSSREMDRPRLLEALALGSDGAPRAGLRIELEIESNGTFDEEGDCRAQAITTGAGGSAYFQWWEYPRSGPRRDFVSSVRATWEPDEVVVYLQDLYE